MEQKDMHEARTNPEFLAYLDDTETKARDTQDISKLYEVLDTLLVLDIDEQRVHSVYEEILKVSFDKIEDRLKDEKKLSLDDEDIYFIRSFYEHAIEKWSVSNFKGAKELFFILTQIVEDTVLLESLNVHLIATAKEYDMDIFYEEKVVHDYTPSEDKYGYFITHFKFDTKEYLDNNSDLLAEQFNLLKHLLS
ncbi:MAG: hypothetical protein U9R37_02595 [Campylobacterota bacterium]|nr:hypothetical protein [Campylobacterota bacterium]